MEMIPVTTILLQTRTHKATSGCDDATSPCPGRAAGLGLALGMGAGSQAGLAEMCEERMLLCDGTTEALDNFNVLRNVCLGQGAKHDFCGRRSVRSESSRVAEVPLIGGESSTLDQAAQTTRGVPSSEPP